MPTMSVWVRKDEVELFKETFLSNELVVEDTIQLNQKPKNFKNSEEHASHLLEGGGNYTPKRNVGQSSSGKPIRAIEIDGHTHFIGGNEEVTDRASSLL